MKNGETWDDRYGLLNHGWLHYGITVVMASPFAASVDSGDAALLVNTGAATIINLPLASENKGKAFFIKKIFAAGGAVTITPQLGDTIDGAASNATITAQYDCLQIVSDGGTGWWIIGEAGPSF